MGDLPAVVPTLRGKVEFEVSEEGREEDVLQHLLKRWSAEDGTVLVAVHDLNLAWALATHALLLDGKGGATCGPRDQVLTADAIGAAYGLPVRLVEDGEARWFRVNLETSE